MVAAANSLEGRTEPFLKRIENLIAAGESAKGTYLAECKERKDDLKELYKEVKEAGISVRALKRIVKQREYQKKIAALDEGLDIDDASQFEELSAAFGDTPMGQYARRRAEGAESDDDERDLRGHQQKRTEAERAEDEVNLAKVGRGSEAVDSLAKPN